MSLLARFVAGAYSKLLSLYPPRFRDEFAAEMQDVFRRLVTEAARDGALALFRVSSREFLHMPFSILKEAWHEVRGKESAMQSTAFVSWQRGSWGESVLAGLPHLLIAMLFTVTGALVNSRLAAISRLVLLLLILAGFLATVYYTWRRHWPVWSASWYGYVSLIVLLLAILPSQNWSGMGDRVFQGIRVILLLLSLATLFYWFSRRNPIEGLLMAIPVIILYWFPVMEFVPNAIRVWLTFWIFLLSALTAMTITRLNEIRRAVWLVLGASTLIGLPIAYARNYLHNIPPGHSSPATLGELAELFSVPWLTSGALVLGPLLVWGVWNLGRKYGQPGRASALLVISGMVVNLLGHFSYWWWFSRETYLNALPVASLYHPGETSSIFLVYAGWAGIFVGALGMAILTWNQNRWLSAALILVPLALPLVARFTTYFGYYVRVAGLSLELARLSVAYKSLVFLLGAGWLALSGWTIARLYTRLPGEGPA